MRQKTIAIFYNINVYIDENSCENGGIGGSETWVVNLSRELEKYFHVVVICKTSSYHFDKHGVEWVPIQTDYYSYINNHKFDLVIVSRNITDIANDLEYSKCTQNVILQTHDVGFWSDNKGDRVCYKDSEISLELIKAYSVVTDNHKQNLHKLYNFPLNNIYPIGYGIDINLIESIEEPEQRDNGVLFSSRWERGLEMLVSEITPEVRKEIPDFYVEFAQYGDIPEHIKNIKGFKGCLNKENLYKEMKKHKVWFYPAIFMETFNITALEAAMCGNELVLPYQDGMESTLKYFTHTGIEHKMNENNYEICKKELIELLISSLKDYNNEYLTNIRKIRQNYVKHNFTWENIGLQWKELIEKILRENNANA